MFENTSYVPEIRFDFLPNKRQLQDAAVSTGKAATVMGSAVAGVYAAERLNVPGGPENVVGAKAAEWTEPLGETGRTAAITAVSSAAGVAASSQLDRLRPEELVEVNGEQMTLTEAGEAAENQIKSAKKTLREVQAAHDDTVENLAESIGMDTDQDLELGDVTDTLVQTLVAQKREKAALENELKGPPTKEDIRTVGIEDEETAITLLETANGEEERKRMLEGEERDAVLSHAETLRKKDAVEA